MGLLDEALAFLDSKKRLVARNLFDLASNPSDVLNQWGSQVKEDTKSLGQVARGVSSSDPQAQQAAVAGLLPLGLLGMTAYHGSPHSFDKFDMSKIGSGEGAQVYGHGLYFAENKAVADTYKHALSRSEAVDANGNVLYSPVKGGDTSPEARALNALQYAHDTQSSSPYAMAWNLLRRSDDAESSQAAQDLLLKWQDAGVTPKPGGKLYKVDIPDEHVARMLDWDAPLQSQPANVQSTLKTIGVTADTGGDAYSKLSAQLGPQRAAVTLRKLGIPGIRYLDGTSRVAGDGTRNMVLFDDTLPQIQGVE